MIRSASGSISFRAACCHTAQCVFGGTGGGALTQHEPPLTQLIRPRNFASRNTHVPAHPPAASSTLISTLPDPLLAVLALPAEALPSLALPATHCAVSRFSCKSVPRKGHDVPSHDVSRALVPFQRYSVDNALFIEIESFTRECNATRTPFRLSGDTCCLLP